MPTIQIVAPANTSACRHPNASMIQASGSARMPPKLRPRFITPSAVARRLVNQFATAAIGALPMPALTPPCTRKMKMM